jgi:hypothetical protein
MRTWIRERLSRRGMLSGGVIAASGAALAALGTKHLATAQDTRAAHDHHGTKSGSHQGHGPMITVGDVDSAKNGFDPTAILTDWETGTSSQLPDGRTLRTFEVVGTNKEIEVAPGIFSRRGPTTVGYRGRHSEQRKAIVYVSFFKTMGRIRTRCTSMVFILRAWTAYLAPALWIRGVNLCTNSTRCRLVATCIIATPCR